MGQATKRAWEAVKVCVPSGDVNRDTLLTPADVVVLLNYVFLGTGNPDRCAADLNCDLLYSAADAVLSMNQVFLGREIHCP